MQLQPGQNSPLSQIKLGARLSWTPSTTALSLDPSAFLLTSSGKVASDEGFIFYGQPKSPDGAVALDAAKGEYTFDLSRLPANVEKVAVALTVEEAQKRGQRFGDLTEVKLEITGGGEPLVFALPTSGMSEAALIVGEFYRRNEQWKFRALGQGFNGGLGPLATNYGVDVSDDSEKAAPAASASPPASPAPPINLDKITLEKKKPISLSKDSGRYGRIVVNLNWTRAQGDGGGGFFKRKKQIDLDLGCFIELKDGSKGVIQALGNTFGAYEREPFAHLLGDDRTGEASEGEFLHINGDEWAKIKQVLVYAFIYEGVPNWAAADGVITIKAADQPELVVRLDSPNKSDAMCAIAQIDNDGGTVKVTKLVEYFPGHKQMDSAHGWGFRWTRGSK